jgi:hypothetical protein
MSEEAKIVNPPLIQPAISFATKAYGEHLLFLLGAFYVAVTVCQTVSLLLNEDVRWLPALIYDSFFTGGLIMIFLAVCDGQNPKFSVLFSKARIFWKYLCAHALVFLACAIGICLLVIPGVILTIRFSFYVPAIAERDLGPIAALKYSWEITRGKFWKLVLFNLVTIAILIVPSIIAGLLISFISGTVASITHQRATSLSEFVTGLATPFLFIWWQLAFLHCYRQLSPPYQSEGTVATT